MTHYACHEQGREVNVKQYFYLPPSPPPSPATSGRLKMGQWGQRRHQADNDTQRAPDDGRNFGVSGEIGGAK